MGKARSPGPNALIHGILSIVQSAPLKLVDPAQSPLWTVFGVAKAKDPS